LPKLSVRAIPSRVGSAELPSVISPPRSFQSHGKVLESETVTPFYSLYTINVVPSHAVRKGLHLRTTQSRETPATLLIALFFSTPVMSFDGRVTFKG
jgi:hypothetical protein